DALEARRAGGLVLLAALADEVALRALADEAGRALESRAADVEAALPHGAAAGAAVAVVLTLAGGDALAALRIADEPAGAIAVAEAAPLRADTTVGANESGWALGAV